MKLEEVYNLAINLPIKYLPDLVITSGDGKLNFYLKEDLSEGTIELVEDPTDECNVISLKIKEFLSHEWKLMIDGKEYKTT